MYAINIAPNNVQKCESCQNAFVEYVGTQAWCGGCNRAIRTIEQQCKVVPKMYQSNCKEKLSSTELKIKAYINEFCNKYGGLSDIEETNFLYHQVLQLKNKKGFTSKNYRQNSAVIVYVHFKDCHRQSIKEFCKKNQVDQKSFNKSYLTYQKLLKQKKNRTNSKFLQDQSQKFLKQEDVKLQSTEEVEWQRQESERNGEQSNDDVRNGRLYGYQCELNTPRESSAKIERSDRKQHIDLGPDQNTTIRQAILTNITLARQVRSFLEAVFHSFFQSLIYQEKKAILINQLTEQILEVYQTLKLILQSSSTSFYIALEGTINENNFYKYLFYLVLRKISHGISQVKYRKVIQEATGENIKATVLKSVIKALDLKEETASCFSADSLFFVQHSGTTGSQFIKIEEKD